jgi:hypothetical protein
MKWNWGVGIAAVYTAFAIATSGFVVFAMNRPVSLVRPDYYAESLREDQQMAARANARQLGAAVSISPNGGDIVRLTVPRTSQDAIAGTVTFYRASDPGADRTLPFSPGANGIQDVNVSKLAAGHWIVKLQWTRGGRDYYIEQPIVLP